MKNKLMALLPLLFVFSVVFASPTVDIATPIDSTIYNYVAVDLSFDTTNDTTLDTCWYSIDSGIYTQVDPCLNTNNVDLADFIDGNHKITAKVIDLSAAEYTDEVNFKIDTTKPTPSNIIVDVTPVYNTYTTEFKIDWTDATAGIDDTNVFLNFDGTDYAMTNAAGTYSANILTGLNAGDYSYYFKAKDLAGNAEQTATATFSISKASSTINLLVDGASASKTISIGTEIPISISGGAGDIKLYKDEVEATQGNFNFTAVGTYVFKANDTGDSNYNAGTESLSVNVIDTQITIISPEAKTYYDNHLVWINFTATDAVELSYNASNGTEYYTAVYTEPVNITLPYGSYEFTFYAKNSLGNVVEKKVAFSLAETPATPSSSSGGGGTSRICYDGTCQQGGLTITRAIHDMAVETTEPEAVAEPEAEPTGTTELLQIPVIQAPKDYNKEISIGACGLIALGVIGYAIHYNNKVKKKAEKNEGK